MIARSTQTHPRRRQSGLSLIELLVSVAISMVVMLAMLQILLGAMQTDRSTSDVARMQESGRNALDLMGYAIRQAGARNNINDLTSYGKVYPSAIAGADGASSAPDTLTVQFQARDGGETDCAGTPVGAGATVTYALTVSAANRTLSCNGTVVANSIEDMQISYAIDAAKDGSVDAGGYISAPTATQFGQVSAIRVSLTVRGSSSGVATSGDGFLRQVYQSTFTVRNQAG